MRVSRLSRTASPALIPKEMARKVRVRRSLRRRRRGLPSSVSPRQGNSSRVLFCVGSLRDFRPLVAHEYF
ncbi:unnamed protein product [Pieris brassicae]|uniref:Uncharacterized protein n=1 Tax=Pieris brassicae TaxID=7116 RepID=A0A9P0TSX4_PIEBR|nr:unnamed protein product [Pieris brassicae]